MKTIPLFRLNTRSFKKNSELKKIFSKNFNHFLKAHNKTQKDLSVALGYPQATISDWSRGVKYPRIDRINRIAQYFNISISELIEEMPIHQEITINFENDITTTIDKLKKQLFLGNFTYQGMPIPPEKAQVLINGIQIAFNITFQEK